MSNPRYRITLALSFFVTSFAMSSTAIACSCAPWSQSQAIEFSSSVFRGTVVMVEPPPEGSSQSFNFRMMVNEVWKGDVDTLTTVVTGADTCGLLLQAGQEYLIYSNLGRIDRCDRSRPVAMAASDLVTLGQGDGPATASTQTVFRNAQISGTWFDPGRSGQGLQIQVLPDGRAVVTFYGHQPGTSSVQLWLYGVGTFVGSELRVDNVFQSSGKGFGNNFSSTTIETVSWGNFRMNFSGESMRFDYAGLLPGYGTGFINMQRLTRVPSGVVLAAGSP